MSALSQLLESDRRWPVQGYETGKWRMASAEFSKVTSREHVKGGGVDILAGSKRDGANISYPKNYKQIDVNRPRVYVGRNTSRKDKCTMTFFLNEVNDLDYADKRDDFVSTNIKRNASVNYRYQSGRYKQTFKRPQSAGAVVGPGRYSPQFDKVMPRAGTLDMKACTGKDALFGGESNVHEKGLTDNIDYNVGYGLVEPRTLSPDLSKSCNRETPPVGFQHVLRPQSADCMYDYDPEKTLPDTKNGKALPLGKQLGRDKAAAQQTRQSNQLPRPRPFGNSVSYIYNPKYNHVTGYKKAAAATLECSRFTNLKELSVADLVKTSNGLITRLRLGETRAKSARKRAKEEATLNDKLRGDGGLQKMLDQQRQERLARGLIRIANDVGPERFVSTISDMTGISKSVVANPPKRGKSGVGNGTVATVSQEKSSPEPATYGQFKDIFSYQKNGE